MDLLLPRHHDQRFRVYASAMGIDFPRNKAEARGRIRVVEDLVEHKALAKVAGQTGGIDYSWLKGASETYQISPNIKDYILTEVPIVTVDFPNRNLHCFPYEEATYFDPRFGQFVYKTFVGKPTYADHSNKDFTKAKGVHFDASLRKVPGWNIWKIYVLLGYDRTKDPVLAQKIERGQRRGYSMGAWVSYFINSITGQIENGSQPLKYPKGTVVNGVLSYSNCSGVEYFECLAKDTLVLTPSGNIPIQDIKVGDLVYNEFGREIKVKKVFQNGVKPVADVMYKGNVLATCTKEHRWQVETGEVKRIRDFTEQDKIKLLENGVDRAISVTYGGNIREEERFDIHVDSSTNLYLLSNGLVTHNTSSVEGPADVTAESGQLWYF